MGILNYFRSPFICNFIALLNVATQILAYFAANDLQQTYLIVNITNTTIMVFVVQDAAEHGGGEPTNGSIVVPRHAQLWQPAGRKEAARQSSGREAPLPTQCQVSVPSGHETVLPTWISGPAHVALLPEALPRLPPGAFLPSQVVATARHAA
jgi:hypothetical protein